MCLLPAAFTFAALHFRVAGGLYRTFGLFVAPLCSFRVSGRLMSSGIHGSGVIPNGC